MAQPAKTLATKPNNLSSIPRVRMVEGEKRFPHIVFCLPHTDPTHRKHLDSATKTPKFKSIPWD